MESQPQNPEFRINPENFHPCFFFFFFFVALHHKSTALVMAGRSVHLTTLCPGQA